VLLLTGNNPQSTNPHLFHLNLKRKNMNTLKTIITFTLLTLITTTVQAAGTGLAKPCVQADLAGTWTAVINDLSASATQQCKMVVNSAGKLTSGSCLDIQSNTIYQPNSGSIKINSQCNVSLSISYTNGGVSKASGGVSRGRDTIIGVYTNNYGGYGSFSAVKY
jgi:hypothetical protein